MLESLTSGIGNLRTRLIIGYSWLFTAWLVLPETTFDRESATGLHERLIGLLDDLGSGASLALLSFAAVSLGSLLQPPYEFLSRLLGQLLGGPQWDDYEYGNFTGNKAMREQQVEEWGQREAEHVFRGVTVLAALPSTAALFGTDVQWGIGASLAAGGVLFDTWNRGRLAKNADWVVGAGEQGRTRQGSVHSSAGRKMREWSPFGEDGEKP